MKELLYLLIGLTIGYFLDKPRVKEGGRAVKNAVYHPITKVLNSKEENSNTYQGDLSNYQHNEHYDNVE